MDEELTSSKKPWIIIGVVLVLLLGIGLYFFFSRAKGGTDTGTSSSSSLFGFLGTDTPRPTGTEITPGNSDTQNNTQNTTPGEEPLFRHLANIPVAGATAVVHDGKTYVRYIARENGYVYEVDPQTGASTQLTNTTIPRIYEAFWGNSGNSVVIRYLTRDQLSRQDVIKTRLTDLALPVADPNGTSTSALGSLTGSGNDFLPDNISTVSISPDGTHLFYLLPVTDGVSGTSVSIATRAAKEVLRSSFSEWLPQILNNGTIILTTKASASVPGFSYLYNPLDKTFSRLVREKDGLTTLAEQNGKRLIYSENISGNTTLSLYDTKGFESDEGDVVHTEPLQLATIPEKCAWSNNSVRIYCGAFTSTPRVEIPDSWYQGVVSFSDTFWTINTDTSEITFLSDPVKENSAGHTFDVFMPFTGGDENHFFFVDKNDATLWSMHIIKSKFIASDEPSTQAGNAPILTPDELKDAAGSSGLGTPDKPSVPAPKK